MIRSRLWCVPAVVALLAPVGLADEGSVTTRDLDARVEKAIFQTINAGSRSTTAGIPPAATGSTRAR